MKDFIEALLKSALTLLTGSLTLDNSELMITQDNVDKVEPLMQVLSCVGMGLTLILFITEINQKFAFEGSNMTLKSLLAPFLKLFMALCIMKKGSDIVGWCISLGLKLVKSGSSVGGSSSNFQTIANDYANSIVDSISGLSILIILVMCIIFIITFLLGLICRLIWWYKAQIYKVQVLWQIVVAPIGFADVYNGLNSQTLRYIKRIIACGVEGMAMRALPLITLYLALDNLMVFDTSLEGFQQTLQTLSGFVQLAICPLIALGALSVTKQVTKEAFGI